MAQPAKALIGKSMKSCWQAVGMAVGWIVEGFAAAAGPYPPVVPPTSDFDEKSDLFRSWLEKEIDSVTRASPNSIPELTWRPSFRPRHDVP